jgi:hypothetical protein
MHDRQALARRRWYPRQLVLDPLTIPHQHDRKLGMIENGFTGTGNDRAWSEVSTHRIQGYAHRITRKVLIPGTRGFTRIKTRAGLPEIQAGSPIAASRCGSQIDHLKRAGSY